MDPSILLHRLSIRDVALDWLDWFIFEPEEICHCQVKATRRNLWFGMPQGSVLRPISFTTGLINPAKNEDNYRKYIVCSSASNPPDRDHIPTRFNLKKILLGYKVFKNIRSVSNLTYLSKIIKYAVVVRLNKHLIPNGQHAVFSKGIQK